MGPLSSEKAVETLDEQVQDAISKGATVLAGGKRIDRPGAWYEPTVLAGITPEMRAYKEELFGPVALLFKVGSEEEAVDFANNSPYGLSASIQTDDDAQAERVAQRLQTGMVFIGAPSGTAAELPFGGSSGPVSAGSWAGSAWRSSPTTSWSGWCADASRRDGGPGG